MSAVNLPQFKAIDVAHFSSNLEDLLQTNREKIANVLKETHFNWDNLIRPLEAMDNELEKFWAPLSHLHAVVNSTELRKCYQACLPLLSAYEASIGQNEALFNAIRSLDKTQLDEIQQKIIEDMLLDFQLSGVALPAEKKQRFEAIQTRLNELSNQFSNNILDAEHAFTLPITDEKRLRGLPAHALSAAKELATSQGFEGWLLNLEFPCYQAVITYAEDRLLREEFYRAYSTRASDQGPNAGQFDNSMIMEEVLSLRHEKANLLGYKNYAELSLATKMAKSTIEVMSFLQSLIDRAKDQAKREYQRLKDFAVKDYDITEMAPWDIAYFSEKKQLKLYAISQEDLRPYFSQAKVLSGLFTIVNKLYGMSISEMKVVDVWHEDVKCYCLTDEKQQIRGYIYLDLFARPNKRNGAWMDSCQSRFKLADGSIQLPIAMLTCNFAKPTANKEANLSHDEVLTLFHEFGHCLHHILTQIDYLSVSGINGVEWDAVELPSQFFENWCWEEAALALLTQHADSGEVLPVELFTKLLAAKNFQSAMAMMRQLEFSLFDFRLHKDFAPHKKGYLQIILAEVRSKTAIVPQLDYNRFTHSFSHIFSGGYAAGYYSYKWAEVLSSDAFSRFEEEGIFNTKTGRDFLHNLLEIGGSKKAAEAYLAFRGRPATVDALLRHNGIQ